MKKTMTAFLSLALVGAMALPSFAADTKPQVLISEKPGLVSTNTAEKTGLYDVQVNGEDSNVTACVMIPLRAIAEELGFKVTWDNGSILIDNGILHTTVTIGVDSYIVTTSVDGLIGMSAPFSLGSAPYVANGVTYVPLSLFDVLLGNKDNTITIDSNKIIIKTNDADKNAQISNPFVNCKTVEEAVTIAGFEISVPDTDSNSDKSPLVRAIKDAMIEVIYGDGENTLCIRKAVGTKDISGDYTDYAEKNTIAVVGQQVTMKGVNGKVNLAIWTNNDYTFSVSSGKGISSNSMAELVHAIH